MWNLIATAYIGALFGLFIAGLFIEPLLLIWMFICAILGFNQ